MPIFTSRPTTWIVVAILVVAAAINTVALAQDNPAQPSALKTVYAHGGKDAWGGGFVWNRRVSTLAAGVDFGIEGEREDLTHGGESTEEGFSFNLLAGINPFKDKNRSAAFFGLVGFRSYKTTCPTGQSYLGYQCYADYDPENHYKINYGGVVMVYFKRIAVGARITGESQTALLGWNW